MNVVTFQNGMAWQPRVTSQYVTTISYYVENHFAPNLNWKCLIDNVVGRLCEEICVSNPMQNRMDEMGDLENCTNDGSHIKTWETYKILNKFCENVHQKRTLARQR